MEQWKIDMNEAKRKKELKKKYPHIGKIVKYKGEYGVVCFDPDFKIEDINSTSDIKYFDDIYAVRWDTNTIFDYEQYGFLDYEYIDSYDFKYINMDGTLKNI